MKNIRVKIDDIKSIKDAIREIREYRGSLNRKMDIFVERLLDVGIKRAYEVGGRFPNRVTYEKHLDSKEDGCVGILWGVGEEIESEWISGGVPISGTLNALWAMEFGTAGFAISEKRFGGKGGAGTASKTGGVHNGDFHWYFIIEDETGKRVRKHATAIEPTRPMLNAFQEMQQQITKIAKEVFDG